MRGVSGTAKSGNTYRYYGCKSNTGKKKCKRKNINKDYIENLVVNKYKQILNDEIMLL